MHAFRVIVLRLTAKWHVDESLIFFLQGTAITPHQARFMSLKTPTLPEKLKKLGYSTHMIGKYVTLWREDVRTSLLYFRNNFILRYNDDIRFTFVIR